MPRRATSASCRWLRTLSAVLLVSAPGCGYTVSSVLPSYIRTIAIPTFANNTVEHGLADDITKKALASKEPKLEIPLRTRSNTIWDKKAGILKMGDAASERELFNLNQAKPSSYLIALHWQPPRTARIWNQQPIRDLRFKQEICLGFP